MDRIVARGSKITFPRSRLKNEPFETNLGEDLLWTKAVDHEIVVAMRARDRHFMERRRIDGSRRWWVDYAPTDEVDVADDSTSLAINGVTFTLPGQLHDAELWRDCVIVLVYPNARTGPRNLYRYNYDGREVWQVEERPFSDVNSV